MRLSTWIVALTCFSSLAMGIEPFNLPWMNHAVVGTEYRSTDYPDGVFVLHMYRFACPLNHHAEPAFNRLAEDYSSQERVQVLDVSVYESDSNFAKWIEKQKPNHPVLKDATNKLWKQLPDHEKGLPMTYILNCKGDVVHSAFGVWNANQEAEIRKVIDGLLSDDCT